jgi:hypothetical protein
VLKELTSLGQNGYIEEKRNPDSAESKNDEMWGDKRRAGGTRSSASHKTDPSTKKD